MPTKIQVRIKKFCTHRVAIPGAPKGTLGRLAKAGETIKVSPAEVEAFGDKFESVTADLSPVEHIARYAPDVFDAIETIEDAEPEVNATPSAAEAAEAAGVDLDDVVGTGSGGKIIKRDVTRYISASRAADEGDEDDEDTD